MTRKPRLLQLQRRAAEIEGSRNMHQAQIARARQSIAEPRMRAADLKARRLNQVVEDLRKVQADLYDLNERVRAARDVLARTDIRASLAGTVVDLQAHTAGGVIAAGWSLLDIVPSDERLVVEAKVDPKDIDVVRPGARGPGPLHRLQPTPPRVRRGHRDLGLGRPLERRGER